MESWLERGRWLLLGAVAGGGLVHLMGTGFRSAPPRAADGVDAGAGGHTGYVHGASHEALPRRERQDDAAAKLEENLAKLRRAPAGSPERAGLITAVVSGFVSVDPARGLEWLRELDPAGGDSPLAAGLLASRLAQDRPDQWRAMVDELEHGQIRDAFVRAGCVGLANHGVDEAWETYLELRDSTIQKEGVDWGVFVGLARSHAVEFWPIAAQVDSISVPGETAAERFFSFARFEDHSDALRIIESLGASESSTAMDAYVRNLMPDRKLEWAHTLIAANMDDDLRDRQLASVVSSTMSSAPGEAARVAAAIRDPALKEEYSRMMLGYGGLKGSAMEQRIREILEHPDAETGR